MDLSKEYSQKNEFPLSQYKKGSSKKVWWICSKCNFEWKTRIQHRFNGSGCPKCKNVKAHLTKAKNKKSILITHPDIASEWDDFHDINLVSFGTNRFFNWKCKKCNNNFNATPNKRCNQNVGCPFCSGRRVTDKNRLSINAPNLAKELFDKTLADFLHCNSSKKVEWQCSNCNHIWSATVNNRFRGRNCPKCAWKHSVPQRIIESWLKQNNIFYKTEFHIKECKNQRMLPFDFAIFNKSGELVNLIEYHGQQHYRIIWSQATLEKVRKNDLIKWNFCVQNKIKLTIIPFWEFDKIDNIMFNTLKDLT